LFGTRRILDLGCTGERPGGCGQQECVAAPEGSLGDPECKAIAPFVPRFGATADCPPIDHDLALPGSCEVRFCDGAGECVLDGFDGLCSDLLECTINACGADRMCNIIVFEAGSCFIGGACYAEGDSQEFEGGCLICDPVISQTAWTPTIPSFCSP
jgi:hypothetical protein